MGKKKVAPEQESFISSTEEVKEELAADVAAEDTHARLYRPSNGTEGECFQGQWCERCTKDDADNEVYCDILTRTAAFGIEDPEYPKEWTYGDDGQPICTAFDGKVVNAEFEESEPVPVGEGEVTIPLTSDGNQGSYVTPEPDKISSTFPRNLPVPVPAEELAEHAKEQARLYGVREKALQDKKASNAGFTRLIKDTEAALLKVSHVVEEGTEERPVICRWEFDYRAGIKKLRRLDNWQVVEEETLQGDELHMSFNFNGSSEKAVEKLAGVQEGGEPPLTDDPQEVVSLPDGYRLLIEGDVMEAGDIYTTEGGVWAILEDGDGAVGKCWAGVDYCPTARQVEAETHSLTEEELDQVNAELTEAAQEAPPEPEKPKGPHACKLCGFDGGSHVYLVRHLRDTHDLKLSDYKKQFPAEK